MTLTLTTEVTLRSRLVHDRLAPNVAERLADRLADLGPALEPLGEVLHVSATDTEPAGPGLPPHVVATVRLRHLADEGRVGVADRVLEALRLACAGEGTDTVSAVLGWGPCPEHQAAGQ